MTCDRFAIEQRAICYCDDAGGTVDRETSPRVVRQRVADDVGSVRVAGKGCDADERTGGRILQHRIHRAIRIGDGRYTRFIDIREIDRQRQCRR